MKTISIHFSQLMLVFAIFICAHIHAQGEFNNWYFGSWGGATFNTSPPSTLDNSVIHADDGCASISTKDGKLLFYTNGLRIWDNTNQEMQNGVLRINPHLTGIGQSVVIVPWPDSSYLYYIFSAKDNESEDGALVYAVVDMRLNGGKGAVISKNNILVMPVCEKIVATKHANKHDYWLLALPYGSNVLLAYRINSTGVQQTAVGSNTGFFLPANPWYSLGKIKVSPNGRKLAYTNYLMNTTVIGDFNASTGKVSNTWSFNSDISVGIEFSPQSKFLYVTEADSSNRVIQYDLSATTKSAFLASAKPLYKFNFQPNALQLGPDGKIYVCALGDSYLSVIHAPDSAGTNCRVQEASLQLYHGYSRYPVTNRLGLPNLITSSLFNHLTADVSCGNDSVLFHFPVNIAADSVSWDFGDRGSGKDNISSYPGNVYHVYKTPGFYTARLISYYPWSSDTIQVKVHITKILKPDLGPDIFSCNHSTTLSSQNPNTYSKYLWTPGGNTSTQLEIKDKGTYILLVEDSNGCISSDTINADLRSSKPIVPNVFTPDGDHINDCYELGGLDPACGDNGKIWVYDRWGILVYEGDVITGCWNGRLLNSGDKLPSGVYYYVLNLQHFSTKDSLEGTTSRGVIHLIGP